MSLLTWLFPKKSVEMATEGYFQTLNAYVPSFSSFHGGIYEASMVRSAIHTFATQCSKLDLKENNSKKYKSMLKYPNQFQTQSQFLYQVATILEVENTCFIFPRLDPLGEKVIELYAVNPSNATVLQGRDGKAYLRAQFNNGGVGVCEMSRVGILTKYQYDRMFFGANNNAILPSVEVMNTTNQGIVDAVKSSATIRFMAKLMSTLKPKDLEEERAKFATMNLSTGNKTGVMMFDAKYSAVKQVDAKPYIIDAQQMEAINENVYKYFGASKNIIMNKFEEDEWNAYYEGKVEPFAIQLSEVLTRILYTDRELGFDESIIATANRLQYASNKTKLEIVSALSDRGMLTRNQGREIFNMEGIGPEGDKYYIRLDYTEAENLDKEGQNANK